MPNIVRIRNLQVETDINDIIIPVDKSRPDYIEAHRVSANDLKNWILSGATIGGASSGTSGVNGINGTSGVNGTSGTSPCITLTSNIIRIVITSSCELQGYIECCDLLGYIECNV